VAKPLEEPVAAYALVIGQKLLAARKARGLSQADVEHLTKIDRANIRKYEKGQLNIGIETLVKIANALGADVVIDLVPRKAGSESLKSE
jgi:transcriptional regulator with XRE-family HTH domain